MGKQPNNGLLTNLKGAVLDAYRVTFGAVGAPTLVDAGRSGAVQSVTRLGTGRYQIQLAVPFYAALITVQPQLSCVTAAGVRQEARYLEGSYSPTAGTFEIDVVANDTTPAVADPTSGSGLDMVLIFQRLKNL